MTGIGRREFVGAVRAGGAGVLTPARGRVGATVRGGRARLADSRIDALVNEPIATIAPELYGHFVEHLGGVVYDGVWVGERSRVPNVGGIRQALVRSEERRVGQAGRSRWWSWLWRARMDDTAGG